MIVITIVIMITGERHEHAAQVGEAQLLALARELLQEVRAQQVRRQAEPVHGEHRRGQGL